MTYFFKFKDESEVPGGGEGSADRYYRGAETVPVLKRTFHQVSVTFSLHCQLAKTRITTETDFRINEGIQEVLTECGGHHPTGWGSQNKYAEGCESNTNT